MQALSFALTKFRFPHVQASYLDPVATQMITQHNTRVAADRPALQPGHVLVQSSAHTQHAKNATAIPK
jgi:hypothetical protein